MNEMEACKEWVQSEFSNIPTELIKKAYPYEKEELELLAGGTPSCLYCGAELEEDNLQPCPYCEKSEGVEYRPTLGWPACWGTMFHPEESLDEDWIRENTQKVVGCGFLIYDCDEVGILLGVDGAGYNFYDAHWLPLYQARGLKWHNK